jgi:MFS family permease
MGAHGAGTLAGMIISGINPNVRFGSLGLTILLTDCLVGALFMPMGLIHASWQGAVLLLLIGMLGGFIQIAVFTWTQRRVPPALMGRAMSLFMFIFMGIGPISAAITGWAMRGMSLPQVFAISGALLIIVALAALVFSPMRSISDTRSLS